MALALQFWFKVQLALHLDETSSFSRRATHNSSTITVAGKMSFEARLLSVSDGCEMTLPSEAGFEPTKTAHALNCETDS